MSLNLSNKIKQIKSAFKGSMIAELEYDTEDKCIEKLDDAYKLYRNVDKRLKPNQRIEVLECFLRKFQRDKELFIENAIFEGGKPRKDTEVEYQRACEGVKVAIRTLQKFDGDIIPMGLNEKSSAHLAFTQKEPFGVVFSISAFNHPINLAIHQIIPALAVSAPVIFKPASKTPLSGKKIVELLRTSLEECGFDKNYVQFVFCERDLTEKLVTDKRVSFMSFIGSEKVGWQLRSKLSKGAKCTLEHGGVAPLIFESDAFDENIDSKIDSIIKAAFYHSGQVCVSLQKLYVQEDIIAKVLEKLISKTKTLKVGDPMDKDTDLGPLIDESEHKRVLELINSVKDYIAYGGEDLMNNCIEPTLILNPPEHETVSTLEAFAPILCIYPYKDIDEAVERANALPYAFQASIFTTNIDKALKYSRRLKSVTSLVNEVPSFRVDWMPFGGKEDSGLGLGGIESSMKEMSYDKQIIIKSDF